MAIYNQLGQAKVRMKAAPISVSTLWNSIYSVYNADSVGSSSLKTSLVSVYNGESNTNDSFGTNNGTAVGGLTYTTGKIGNAFNLNGTNAYVSLPNNSLNFTGDFSYSFWIYPNNTTNQQMLICNWKPGLTYGYGYYCYMINGYFVFEICQGNNKSIYNVSLSWSNRWYNIIITRKLSTITKIYIDGTLNNGSYTMGNQNQDPLYQTDQINNIGTYNNGNGVFFNGKIDAVNIWNKELTQSEITELYNSGNGSQYITDNFYKPTTNDALNTYNETAQGGLTYGVGKVGTAFQFNGTNAYVQLGDVMDIGLSSWSYSMWFNVNNISSTRILFSKTLSGESTGRIRCSVTTGGVIRFAFSPTVTASTDDIDIQTTNTISLDTWYHVVFVLDRTNNMKIYLNGVLQSVTVSVASNNLIPYSALNFNNSHPFRIGSATAFDNTSPTGLFSGSIDAFNVWNRVLTQSEITELYNSGNGKQYPN